MTVPSKSTVVFKVSVKLYFITVMSHDSLLVGFSNHRWLDWFINSLFILTTKRTINAPHHLTLCAGNPPIPDGFTAQKGNCSTVMTSWCTAVGTSCPSSPANVINSYQLDQSINELMFVSIGKLLAPRWDSCDICFGDTYYSGHKTLITIMSAW